MERESSNRKSSEAVDALSQRRLKQLRAMMLATGITLGGLVAKSPHPDHRAELVKPTSPTVSQPERTEVSVEPVKLTNQPETVEAEPMAWLPEDVKQEWPVIEAAAIKNNIDPQLLAIIIAEESLGKNLQNPSGASGPAQVMQTTADGLSRFYHEPRLDTTSAPGSIEAGALAMRYIKERQLDKLSVEPYSDEWIYLMAIGYGDGEPALTHYLQTGQISDQAQRVAPIWLGMWHERASTTSPTLKRHRGIGE
jgi:hypothetical protein